MTLITPLTPGVWHAIRQTVIDDHILKDSDANKRMLESLVNEDQGEQIGPQWLKQLTAENPSYGPSGNTLLWESADVLDPAKRRQQAEQEIAESRKIFSEAARHFKTFSDNEANFKQVCSVLGNSFNRIQFQQAFAFGSLTGLVPASAEELEQWKQEQIKAENKFVHDATSPYELSQAKQIVLNRRLENQRTTAQARLEQNLVETYLREVTNGPKEAGLPSEYLGTRLDAEFIKKASTDTLRKVIGRWGSSQLTARLHGIKKAEALIDFGDGRGPVDVVIEFQ